MPKNTLETDQSEKLEQLEKELTDLKINIEKQKNLNIEENIFKILKNADHEIRHSAFLAWLLNPNESHGLKGKFLNKFFGKELVKNGEENTVTVQTEYEHIDIFIKGEDFICVIENKYGSEEHDNQLERYIKTVEKLREETYSNIPEENLYFVYLDLSENYFNENNLGEIGEKHHYKLKTYTQVKEHLKDAAKLIKKLASKTYINDYINILEDKKMTTEINSKMLKIYKKYKDVLEKITTTLARRNMVREIVTDCIKESKDFGCVKECSTDIKFLPNEFCSRFNEKNNNYHFKFIIWDKENNLNELRLCFVAGPDDDKNKLKIIINKIQEDTDLKVQKKAKNCAVFELMKMGVNIEAIENKKYIEIKEYIENKLDKLKNSEEYSAICNILKFII